MTLPARLTSAALRAELGLPAAGPPERIKAREYALGRADSSPAVRAQLAAGDGAGGAKRRAQPEREIQEAVAEYLRAVLDPELVRFTHVPNERRDKLEAVRMLRAGVASGWPDLEVAWSTPAGWFNEDTRFYETWRTPQHGYIELKAPAGSLTPEQRELRDWFQKAGHLWSLCRSLDDVKRALREWGVPIKQGIVL